MRDRLTLTDGELSSLIQLRAYTRQSYNFDLLRGDDLRCIRRALVERMLGHQILMKDAGINAMRAHFIAMAQIEGAQSTAHENQLFREWAGGRL